MFCTQCGSNIPDGSKFCHVCGAEQIRPNANNKPVPQEQQVGITQPYEGYNSQQIYGNQTQPVYDNQTQPVYDNQTQPVYNGMSPQVYEDNTQFVELKKPTDDDLNVKKQNASKSGNKGLIIGISIFATILVAVAIVLIVLNPFKKDDKDKTSGTTTESVAGGTDGKKTDTTVTEQSTTQVADSTSEESVSEASTTQEANTDKGGSFGVVNGILTVDSSLFGMSYDELNSYLNNSLPAKEYWEWSDVPLDYLNYVYSDGNNYVLYFENNILVGIRYGYEISENVIPSELLTDAINKFGDYDMYWYVEDTMQNTEYDWDYKIKSRTGEYAIFLNTYDDKYHLEQQYTSADYSGESIQNH
ncbi:MAG: zinc ribbon domain-containing protein [Lachnospiraceae bacterium]|nr:zinc ribbon domain-containing protein [Lachnospiraceae bacterium]